MKEKSILLLHGFCGSTDEIANLKTSLENEGYNVLAPSLGGISLGYKFWIKNAEVALLKLKKLGKPISVIGFSMGGLIAVQLYCKHGFDEIVTINTPVYYWNFKQMGKNVLSDFKRYSKQYLFSGKDMSFHAMLEFQKLLSATKKLFCNVKCRSLNIQALDDDTVRPRSCVYICSKMNGDKRLVFLKTGGHQVFNSGNSDTAIKKIQEFLRG